MRKIIGHYVPSVLPFLIAAEAATVFDSVFILFHTVQIVLFTSGSGEWNSAKRLSTTSGSCAA